VTSTPSKITDIQKNMLRLIERSPATEGGWRQVKGDAIWKLVIKHSHPELTELDHELKRVRLTPAGMTVIKYLL
jgi:hypothetical protein